MTSHPSTMDTPKAQPRAGFPCPLPPTQLCTLLWRGCLLVVGFVGHGAGDAALAPALAVGSFATFGGDSFLLIVVFSRCVVVLVPAKTGREGKKKPKCCLVGLIFRSSNYFSAHVWGFFFFVVGFLGGQVCSFFADAGSFPGWDWWWGDLWWGFLSAAGCGSTTKCTQRPDGDRFNTRPFKFIPASSSFIFLKGTCW